MGIFKLQVHKDFRFDEEILNIFKSRDEVHEYDIAFPKKGLGCSNKPYIPETNTCRPCYYREFGKVIANVRKSKRKDFLLYQLNLRKDKAKWLEELDELFIDHEDQFDKIDFSFALDFREIIDELRNESIEAESSSDIESNFEQNIDEVTASTIEKRAEDAEIFLDILIQRGYIKTEKSTIRKYFTDWFRENKNVDLQFSNGDFLLEDGDFQIVQDFQENDIVDFLSWYKNKETSLIDYLKENGIKEPGRKKWYYSIWAILTGGLIFFGTLFGIINDGFSISDKLNSKSSQTISTGKSKIVLSTNPITIKKNDLGLNVYKSDTIRVQIVDGQLILYDSCKLIKAKYLNEEYLFKDVEIGITPLITILDYKIDKKILNKNQLNTNIIITLELDLIPNGYRVGWLENGRRINIAELTYEVMYENNGEIVKKTISNLIQLNSSE